jgi:hypothetical protein
MANTFDEHFSSKPREVPLEEQVVAHVRDWFARASQRAANWRNNCETLELRLHDGGADDDGTLYLSASVRETSAPYDIEGRVPGVRAER